MGNNAEFTPQTEDQIRAECDAICADPARDAFDKVTAVGFKIATPEERDELVNAARTDGFIGVLQGVSQVLERRLQPAFAA